MPSQEALELAEIIMGMPRDKRAKAYKEAIDAGVVFDFEPADTEAFVKAVGAFTPELPKLPNLHERKVEMNYTPNPTKGGNPIPVPVLQLGPAQKAAQADISRIAENAPRSLNPMDWITSGGKSPIPALVEGGANFLAGAKDELLQGKPGPWQQRLLAALARGGLNVAAGGAMNAATGREPEAGSAHNFSAFIPGLPGAKGVGLNALSTGAAQGIDTFQRGSTIDAVIAAGIKDPKRRDVALENRLLEEKQNLSPATAGVGAAALSGGIGGALKGVQTATRAGMAAPAAREELATELYKRRHAPPSAKGSEDIVLKNAQDLSNLSPKILSQIKNYAPNSPIKPDVPNAAFDEILSRTGFDIRAMNKTEWQTIKQIAKEAPDTLYAKVVDPIFSATSYSNLGDAAKTFNKNVTNIATLAGKDRAAVLKGVRNAFVTRLFQDDDVMKAGQIVNPDSLRYRVESIGPDMFNQIFSDSPSTKSQASGAYDAFKTVIDLAEKGSRTNLTHDVKVFLAKNGPVWLRGSKNGGVLDRVVNRITDFPLNTDKSAPGSHSKGALAALGTTGLISGKTAAAYAGLEIAEYTWDTFFDKFAKKNSRLMPILRSLSEPSQNYSATSIDRAIQTMFDAADTKQKRERRGENWADGATQLK